jgi:peptidoglycan L-alanyl-D-glutamate endopeptidase CwlK
MPFSFSKRSLHNLEGVHPDLAKVAHAALRVTPLDFGVIEGLRSGERQHELFLAGKSLLDWPTPAGHSPGRHLTGKAIDFIAYIDGVATETDLDAYATVADAFKAASRDLGVPIAYGGDWASFKDADHIELDRHAYPDDPSPLIA